jgi:DNA-binding response OmpR family regulator
MVTPMRILVVEDDAPLASFVRKGLEAEHYAVDVAPDGELARLMALDSEYDLLILDLNLPKLDGISVLNAVRPKKPSLPVLVLTARSRVEDRVQSLDTGADDCLIKPFSFTELSARVRALLRRGPRTVEAVLRVADLELDRVERKVERAGRRIELTSKEFALLEYLMRNAGRRVTRAMIVEHVWNLSFDTTTNIVDVYINYNGHYVFAGTANAQPPYVVDDTVPGGIAYQGNDNVNSVEIETGQSIAVNQPGSQLFSAAGANVFQSLNDLVTALQDPSSTTDDIGNATTEIRNAYDQLTSARAFYGSAIDRVLSSQDFINSESVQLSQQQNSTVGVDMNVAATNLANAEEARSAAVQAAATTSSLSLMDYLSGSGH